MGQISIRLTDKDEAFLKEQAAANNQSLAEFCRNNILSKVSSTSSMESTNNILVESAINEMNNNMQDMLKKLIVLNHNLMKENRYYGELLGNYFTALFTSQETNLQESFDLAQQAAEESVKDL